MALAAAAAAESLLLLGFVRWAWRRCSHHGTLDSDSWPLLTSPSDFDPVPRACRAVLAVYEDDLSNPRWAPSPVGYRMDPASVLKRLTYADTRDRCPPYIIYLDRAHKELLLAVRGLNLVRDGDYRMLLDNAIQPFDGGYVHRGLLKAATWILNREADTLARLLKEFGDEYKLVLAGHSLGAGVAAMMAVVVVNYLDRFGGIERDRVRCYALAPVRCMSLGLTVKYTDVIHSVVLQDDFLPRTPSPLEYTFGSIFCLPCLLFLVCVRDTFTKEEKNLKDPRRLYAPGRIYHIVNKKPCSCGRTPPYVRTAIQVEGRFEHIVLSCNATSDHSIVWLEHEAQMALDRMNETTDVKTPPKCEKMERESFKGKDHNGVTKRSVTLDVQDLVESAGHSLKKNEDSAHKISSCSDSKSSGRSEWDELVENLFDEEESEELIVKEGIPVRL